MFTIKSLSTQATHFISALKPRQHIAILVALSFLVVLRITNVQHGWVNDDSLLYFEVARLLSEGQWQAAYHLFPWLFYPGLLALGHVASGLDIHTTAQIINIGLFTLFSWGFASLILQAGGSIKTMWWGGLLLLSTQYIVGDILGMLLRDEGFWACLTWALVFLLRYMQQGQKNNIYYFQIAIIIAMLFRLEGILYFILAFVLMAEHTLSLRHRLCKVAQNLSLPICASLLIGATVITGIIKVEQLGRLQEIIYLVQQGFIERLHFIQSKAEIMSSQVLGHYLENYGNFGIWSVLILITLNKTLKVAGWPVLLGIVTGRKACKHINHHARQLFSLHLIIGLISSFLIIINVFVLSSRYVIASGIVLLVIGAFCIEHLYLKARPWGKYGLLLLFSAMLYMNLHDSGRIDLDRQAVEYIQSINISQQPVLYDTENARFYAHQPFMNRIPSQNLVEELLANGKITNYSFLMISINNDDGDYELSVTHQLDQHFQVIQTLYGWKHKSKVLIYKKNS